MYNAVESHGESCILVVLEKAERIIDYACHMHSDSASRHNFLFLYVAAVVASKLECYAFFLSVIEAVRLRIKEKGCTV